MEFLKTEPSIEHYLAQVAFLIAKANPKLKQDGMKMSDFILTYKEAAPVKLDKHTHAAYSKAKFFGALGLTSKTVKRGKPAKR